MTQGKAATLPFSFVTDSSVKGFWLRQALNGLPFRVISQATPSILHGAFKRRENAEILFTYGSAFDRTRVQYAYIEEPKIDQTSLHQPEAPLAKLVTVNKIR